MALLALMVFGWGQKFDAERIVARSKLNGRTFQGEVQEVSALDGAVTAYLMEEHSVPLVAVSFGFDYAGKAYEPKEGVALMMESVLLDGAGDYSRQELRALMKEKGIRLEVSANRDRVSFLFSYVKEFEKEAVDVLKAVLYNPHLDEEDLALARRQLVALKKQQLENPQYHLKNLVNETFYKNHPYGKDSIADERDLANISADDIRAYMRQYMGRNNLKVGISGDMDRAETEAFLTQAFAGLSEKVEVQKLPQFVPEFLGQTQDVDVLFSAQSFVLMVAQGIKRLDEDFYPLYIADYILGGSGLNSKLNQAVREEQGLTYGIYSGLSNSDAVDLWQVSFSATPENVDKAIEIVQNVYSRFYNNGVTEDEVIAAKEGLLNSFNLRFASLFNVAEMLEQMQVQNLGKDFLKNRQDMVRNVSLDDVNRAIRKHMPERFEIKSGVRFFRACGKKL